MQRDPALVPVPVSGWRTGFLNMLAKEHGVWWRTRRWAVHLILWMIVLNGFLLLVNFGDGGPKADFRAPGNLTEIMEVFFRACSLFASIGVITVTQSLMVSEKQLGTMAWLLTKPISRPSVVLAKVLESSYVVLLLMVVIPAVLVCVQTRLVWGIWPRFPGFWIGLGLVALSHVFYVAFTIMLGTIFQKRGPVSGCAFGFLFAGMILPNWLPKWIVGATPWALHPIAAAFGTGQKVPALWYGPAIATVVLTLVCIGVSLWRFEREEF
jgi:ABC-2 type transport system permease protein